MSASTWTRLQLSEALEREENYCLAVVPTCLVFKMAFPPLRTYFSALPVGRCSRNFSIILSSKQIIKTFSVYFLMKYMVFGFHRFLKVAVIGKMLLQSSGLMKTVAVTTKQWK